jgi:hypothetical protein
MLIIRNAVTILLFQANLQTELSAASAAIGQESR